MRLNKTKKRSCTVCCFKLNSPKFAGYEQIINYYYIGKTYFTTRTLTSRALYMIKIDKSSFYNNPLPLCCNSLKYYGPKSEIITLSYARN